MKNKFLFLVTWIIFFSISAYSQEYNAHVEKIIKEEDSILYIYTGAEAMLINFEGHDYIAYPVHLDSCQCMSDLKDLPSTEDYFD